MEPNRHESPSRAAAFTIVRDEPVFLALWHMHYARHFAKRDLYVLHHVASDEEVAVGTFADALAQFDAANVTRLVNADFDPAWLGDVVSAKVNALLLGGEYAAVLFAESDELLVHADGGLGECVRRFAADEGARAVRCVGYELHHDFVGGEPPLDTSRPILEQRRRWHRNVKYDKALLTKQPLTWSLGFHTCDEPTPQDEQLLLVHLHKYDLQCYLTRHEERARYKHSQRAIDEQWNAHYRKVGAELFAQYISLCAPLEDVPVWVRSALTGI